MIRIRVGSDTGGDTVGPTCGAVINAVGQGDGKRQAGLESTDAIEFPASENVASPTTAKPAPSFAEGQLIIPAAHKAAVDIEAGGPVAGREIGHCLGITDRTAALGSRAAIVKRPAIGVTGKKLEAMREAFCELQLQTVKVRHIAWIALLNGGDLGKRLEETPRSQATGAGLHLIRVVAVSEMDTPAAGVSNFGDYAAGQLAFDVKVPGFVIRS